MRRPRPRAHAGTRRRLVGTEVECSDGHHVIGERDHKVAVSASSRAGFADGQSGALRNASSVRSEPEAFGCAVGGPQLPLQGCSRSRAGRSGVHAW